MMLVKKLRLTIAFIAVVCVVALMLLQDSPAKAETVPDLDAYDALITFDVIETGGIYRAYTFKAAAGYVGDGSAVETAVALLRRNFGSGWTYDIDKDTFAVTMYQEFDTITDFYAAYGRDGYEVNDNSDNVVVRKAFFSYMTTNEPTVFESSAGTPVELFAVLAESLNIEKSKMLRAFRYGTKYKKMVTSSADMVVEYQNYNLHVFYVLPDNLGRTYSMTYKNVNATTWYLLAVAMGGIVAVVTTVAIAINKKKKGEVYYG